MRWVGVLVILAGTAQAADMPAVAVLDVRAMGAVDPKQVEGLSALGAGQVRRLVEEDGQYAPDLTWEPPGVRGGGHAAVGNGRLYFSGGDGDLEAMSIDLLSGEVTSSGPHPSGASQGRGAALAGDRVYIGTGTTCSVRSFTLDTLSELGAESAVVAPAGDPNGYLMDLVWGPAHGALYTLWSDGNGRARVMKLY
jgi:hypothetical protein